jgi:hypothetical protein
MKIQIGIAASPFLSDAEIASREIKIHQILERGNVAVFTMKRENTPSIIKKATSWIENENDLIASSSNGACNEICWQSRFYELSEEDAEGNPVSS